MYADCSQGMHSIEMPARREETLISDPEQGRTTSPHDAPLLASIAQMVSSLPVTDMSPEWGGLKSAPELGKTTARAFVYQPKTRRTEIIEAASSGKAEAVRQLIGSNADINATEMMGKTALYMACLQGHTSCAEALVDAGADIHVTDKEFGYEAFEVACAKGHAGCLRVLIGGGADVNMIRNGITPIHSASANGHEDCVKPLLDAGAKGQRVRKRDKVKKCVQS